MKDLLLKKRRIILIVAILPMDGKLFLIGTILLIVMLVLKELNYIKKCFGM
jgi:hypothetical protein